MTGGTERDGLKTVTRSRLWRNLYSVHQNWTGNKVCPPVCPFVSATRVPSAPSVHQSGVLGPGVALYTRTRPSFVFSRPELPSGPSGFYRRDDVSQTFTGTGTRDTARSGRIVSDDPRPRYDPKWRRRWCQVPRGPLWFLGLSKGPSSKVLSSPRNLFRGRLDIEIRKDAPERHTSTRAATGRPESSGVHVPVVVP